MKTEELWKKMQDEFSFIKEKIKDIDVIREKVSRIDVIEEKVKEIDVIKEKVSRIDAIEEKVNEIDNVKSEIKKINDKLDVITNVNMAQILNEQRRTREELNRKIDNFMLQNNVEHKQFAYQIAKLERENGISKIG